MLFNTQHKRTLLFTAISTMSLLPLSGMTLAQDDAQIEEVVVTGSFIRRSEGFDQASSVLQFTAEDLENQGTLNLGEVIQQLSFVNGSASAITTMAAQGGSSRTTSIDLRGLGARSTLTLLDGKRLVSQNVNALIPTIALQRMDIVADGAAALYGSEAVAGVVNFVPYKSYDGLKLETFAEGDSEGDWDQHSAQLMWGGDVGGIDVVVAGQFRQQSRLGRDERDLLANSGNNISSNGSGNWRVPQRDESGLYTGVNVNMPSPNCAPASERTSYTNPGEVHNAFGMLDGGNCWFDFGDNRSFMEPESHNKLFGNATWEVNDNLTISAQGFRSRQWERSFRSTSNPSNPRIGELPAVRGEIPGNPYRAVNSSGSPLFGVDANGDGIPDRSPGIDLNSDGWDDYIVSGIADNGVPLMEDVLARRLRPINKTHTRSAAHTSDMDLKGDGTDIISRWNLQADFNVPFVEGWVGSAAWTQNRQDYVWNENRNLDISSMIQGLNCDVANDRDACYSPFMIVNQADNNSIQMMDAVAAVEDKSSVRRLDTLDLVFNGEIPLGEWELPGGAIGAAFGYQYREETYTNTPTEGEIAGTTWIGSAARETVTSGNREVDSFFAELAIPILPNLEASAAIRREDFSTGQESTDPKFGLTYSPTEWLTLRATKGDAFIAPSLEELLNPITCGLTNIADPFSDFEGFSSGCRGGNPGLQNESSESSQFGIDLAFGNFDFSVTWNNTEFQNRIVATNGEQLMNLDFFNFQQATGFAGDGRQGNKPSLQQLTDWVNNPASNKDIIRDPQDLGTVLQINGLGTTNAERVEVTAYDVQSNYRFGVGDFGDVRIGLTATYIDEFLVQQDATQPEFNAVGHQNRPTGTAPTLPRWKANLQAGWTLNNHSVVATAHYLHDVRYDGGLRSFLDRFAGHFRPGGMNETGIKAWTDMDLNYSYRGLSAFGGEFSFTLGSRNIFDRAAQRSPMPAGILAELQDPLGRVFYGRMVYDF